MMKPFAKRTSCYSERCAQDIYNCFQELLDLDEHEHAAHIIAQLSSAYVDDCLKKKGVSRKLVVSK